MRRWHQERDLMLRRWRLEIAQHEMGASQRGQRRYGRYDFAPLPPASCEDACHCYRGAGYFRKRHPLDCGHTRCGLCSWHKQPWETKRRRRRDRQEAIAFELQHC
jgi:hypothetical protein